MKTTRVCSIFLSILAFVLNASVGWAYSKPITYRQGGSIVFKDEYLNSPHSWIIVKAVDLLRKDGYTQEADVAKQYLLPMLEGVTFNDVWGDADLAGGSICDYYCPESPDSNYGYGESAILGIFAYKNGTASFKTHPLYLYENAAEEAQYRYDYAKRIYLGHWGDDSRDQMAGWVVDTLQSQDDPQSGKWAEGTTEIDAGGKYVDSHTRFGDAANCDGSTGSQTPASALLDLLQNHSTPQVVFPDQTDPDLSTIYLPTREVIEDHGGEWFDDHFCDADDVEAYMGYDGHGFAVYANWTLDAGGTCSDGDDDCASPMIVRLATNSYAHAFFQLGWALHLLEDQTTPVHTINDDLTTFEVHNDVERMADLVLIRPEEVDAGIVTNLLPALDLASFQALYDWPPPHCTPDPSNPYICAPASLPSEGCASQAPNPTNYFKARWYTNTLARASGEGVAHAYCRVTAEMTVNYMPYIECMNTEDNLNYPAMGCFTALGLDLGIKSAAGLIRQFLEEVDHTPPRVLMVQPTATEYLHTATLTLNYFVTDDLTGVKSNSVTATLDGMTMLSGHSLTNGLTINLLTEVPTPGDHTFTVTALDNAGNSVSKSVTFSIAVTAQSIMDDISYFLSIGAIAQNEGRSLLSKLASGAKARAKGNCPNAATIYTSFISEVQAQSGKSIDPTAATILIADSQYLIAHCP
jgi:hypothetical protein